jgi:DNA-binding IscR family transcriptional regulator
MLRLSKKADYALIAMKHLARLPGDAASTSAREIAEQYDIPLELMVSTQGTRGGYTLQRASNSITVADVIQAIDGPFTVTACSSDDHDCEQFQKCSIRDPLWRLRERIVEALGTVSVAELASDADREQPVIAAPVSVLRRAHVQ